MMPAAAVGAAAGGAAPPPRWCVVGAGPAGLAALKELNEVGIEASCFELQPAVGGVFAKAYEGLLMTSSSVMTAFSSHSDGAEAAPRHWTGPEYLAYLDGFVSRFGLARQVKLSTRVEDVAWDAAAGKWLVTWRPVAAAGASDANGGSPVTEAFDGVAICAGAHNFPRAPPLEGGGAFEGRVVHSAEVRDFSVFAGRRVAVVGAGESGSDLANAVSRVAAATCIVVRRTHGHLIARESAVGARRPNDLNTNRARYSIPLAFARPVERTIAAGKRLQAALLVRDPARAAVLRALVGLNAQQGTTPCTKYGAKSSGFVEAVLQRGARFHRGGFRLAARAVEFDDGAPPFEADVVLACSGFEQRYPFLERAHAATAAAAANPRRLWKNVFPPEHGGRLAFLGTARPAFGAIPPLAELQARLLAAVAAGAARLPPPAAMAAEARRDREAWEARFADDPAIPALVDHQAYADQLAAVLGVLPPRPGLGLALSDPALWAKLMFGPLAAAQYRLRGPGADPANARATLMRCPTGAWLECGVSFAFLLLAKLLSALVPGCKHLRPLNF